MDDLTLSQVVDDLLAQAASSKILLGNDLVFTLGDNAGANKFSVRDSDLAEVFKVDSNGIPFFFGNDLYIRNSKIRFAGASDSTLDIYTATSGLRMRMGPDITAFNNLALGGSPASPNAYLYGWVPDVFEQRRGINPQEFRVFNEWLDVSNSEWLEFGFQDTADTAVIKTGANGTGTVRSLRLQANNGYVGIGGAQIDIAPSGAVRAIFNSSGYLISRTISALFNDQIGFSSSSSTNQANTNDTYMYRVSAGVMGFNGAVGGIARAADPDDPANGSYVLWLSDGTESGDAGDLMLKITDAGGTTKTITLADFSAF